MRNTRRGEVETRKKRKRTIFLTLGFLVVIYLFLAMVLGENGLLRFGKLRSTRADLKAEIRRLEKQNEETKRQIEALKKDPNLLEELARKQGLTKEDELIFKFEQENKE